METTLHRKRSFRIYLSMTVVSGLTCYLYQIPHVGYQTVDNQFFENGKGAAMSAGDLPVQISVQPGKTDPKETTLSDQRYNSDLCERHTTLCKKILFVGEFSRTQKEHYQNVIISQIVAIDSILTTQKRIASSLYSLTIHNNKGTRRGRAGNATISIYLQNMQSDVEFLEILTHELGHIVDLSVLKGKGGELASNFYNIDKSLFYQTDPSIDFYQLSWLNNITRKSTALSVSFVGGYAMSDPFEDFAETFNMYLNHHHVFALISGTDEGLRKKYQFMQALFDEEYLQADLATALHMKNRLQTRARDTTKGY